MRSKRLKGIMAVVLALACVLPMPVSGQTAGDTGKIDEYLLEKMEQYTGELPVYICVKMDIPPEEAHAMEQEEFSQMAKEFRNEVGLDDNNLVLNEMYMYQLSRSFRNYIPLTTAWLTGEEILAMSSNERVARVAFLLEDPSHRNSAIYVPFFESSFNAERALFLLQISVGLHVPGERYIKDIDVDRNGQIGAYDALLALQESVGLIAIGRVMYLYTWQSTILIEGAYDWERIPPDFFLCANDVNGDGVADALDILIKYNEWWL